MPENDGPAEGKKIFLLYPHSVIQQEMLDVLIMAGYETYTLNDEKRAVKILEKFPGSIMFINIDEHLKEEDWEKYVRNLLDNAATKSTHLGIMSYNQDKALMQKYLIDLQLPCGYVQLKIGLQESTRIILKALEAAEARGRRKFIRADCAKDLNATLNYKADDGRLFNAKIMDISSAGVAAKFDQFPAAVSLGDVLSGVQMRLRGGMLLADMAFRGKRRDNPLVYILMFDEFMGNENKLVVFRYIKQCLQKYIDEMKV